MVWLNCVPETLSATGGGTTDGEIPAGMPDMNAMMATATRNAGYTGMAPPSEVKDVLYVCVVDIRVTDRSSTSGGHSASHAVRRSNKLNIEGATPIVREKLTAGIDGLF